MDDELHPFVIFLKRFYLEIILLFLAVTLTIFSFVLYKNTSIETQHNENTMSFPTDEKNPVLMAELSGAVIKPGVYSLPQGSRIKDLLEKGKGLQKDADTAYISRNINLARYLGDQEKIYIPTVQEITDGIISERRLDFDYLSPQVSSYTDHSISLNNKIHINSATGEELDSLPGIGESTVNKIINNRPFTNIEDLVDKKIVTKTVFNQVKDLIDL